MSRLRPARPLNFALAAGLSLLSLTGCKKGDDKVSTDPLELIPAGLHAVYGRTAADAPGMTVSATGLEFRTMKLVIHEGKMEGDTVRVERATLTWEKLEPKTCMGTISRRDENLLLSLFDVNHPEAKCEPILDTQWFHWVEVEAMPEVMLGRYDVLVLEPRSMRLDIDWLHAELEVGKIWQLPGTNDERAELLIDMAKVSTKDEKGEMVEHLCDGKLTLIEGRLASDFWVPESLIPAEDPDEAMEAENQAKLEAHRENCNRWDGGADKSVARLDDLPKGPISAGEVKLSISPTTVVLDSPALRCEQELWQTSTVDNQAGWNGARFGGEKMMLGRATATKVSDDCKVKLRIYCEREAGYETADIELDAEPTQVVADCIEWATRDLCPTDITVREISGTRYKVYAEPMRFNEIACVDTSPEFTTE